VRTGRALEVDVQEERALGNVELNAELDVWPITGFMAKMVLRFILKL
jgi:hypothetical protein